MDGLPVNQGKAMPKTTLTPTIVQNTQCPVNQRRVDLYDMRTKGLLLEVRPSGGKTYYLRYTDRRGRTRQIKLADSRDISLHQARQLADQTRNQIAIGLDPLETQNIHRSMPTLDEFFYDRYLPFVKSYKRSWQSDESYYRIHIQRHLGYKHLDEINKHDIIKVQRLRLDSGGAVGSANRQLVLIRYIFNLAIRWETPGVSKNPSAGIRLFEDLAKKERFLSVEEAKRLYEAVQHSDNSMLQYIIPMLILTGARKREVLDAQWQDFDLKRRDWRIPMSKSGRPRHVPLSEGVIQLLATVPTVNLGSFVFANPKTGRPYVSIFNSWNSARKLAGLSDVRIHDLRHSFASFLVNNGRSLYEVQKILGHTQIKTTQRYAHLSQDTLLDAANTACAVLNSLTQERQTEINGLTPPFLTLSHEERLTGF